MKVLLILPSVIFYKDINLSGVKAKLIYELKQKFEKMSISLSIATVSGSQPYINTYKEDSIKNWISNFIEETEILNINSGNLSSNNFDALIIPSFITIYNETNQLLIDLVSEFHHNNKPILANGHSVFVLTKIFDKDCKSLWGLINYKLTGTTIYSFINDNLYEETEYSCEELITLQGGIFISSLEDTEYEVFYQEDKNIITGMNDNSFSKCLEALLNKLFNLNKD